jgi:hypothetical protein
MPNRPSQQCRVCTGRGWFYRTPTIVDPCELCRGRGRITIRLARILGWRPILHRKRGQYPKQLPLIAGGGGQMRHRNTTRSFQLGEVPLRLQLSLGSITRERHRSKAQK